MAYLIHAKVKDSAFSVIVETAQEALAKVAELSEDEHIEVTIKDLTGTVVEAGHLIADGVDVGN